MKIVYNRRFPLRPFWAINICGLVFCREDVGRLTTVAKNHEYIHSLQQREMGYIGFFVWYGVEWLVRLFRYRNAMQAYRTIGFEREAYAMERDLHYAERRRHFSWLRYYSEK